MRRALLSVVLLLVALVLQLTVLDQLPLPGGVSPDLVLLVVVALALGSGPMPGMIGGFCAGLALDIVPPSGHLIGLYALVFCLAGYFCGLVSAELDSSVLLPLAASALGAAGGAGLFAVVGVILGNPDVTGSAVRHVLPLSVLYDVLLSPFVLYAVALCFRANASGLAASRWHGSTAGAPAPSGEAAAGLRPSALQTGRTPRIRAGAARPRDGWIGGGGWLAASAELARRQPATVRLRLGGQRTAAAPARTGTAGGVSRLRFGAGRRGDAVLGRRLLGGGFFSELSGGGSGRLGPAGGRRIFARRSWRGGTAGAAWARLIRRPSWGQRGTGGAGSGPRRGSFSASTPRKGPGSAASPRRGTFRASSLRRRTLSTGSPRRGVFGGGSSARGSLGSGSARRGAFGGGPRRLRTLRRATLRGGSQGLGRSALGRVRGGRSPAWRFGRKRGGGYR